MLWRHLSLAKRVERLHSLVCLRMRRDCASRKLFGQVESASQSAWLATLAHVLLSSSCCYCHLHACLIAPVTSCLVHFRNTSALHGPHTRVHFTYPHTHPAPPNTCMHSDIDARAFHTLPTQVSLQNTSGKWRVRSGELEHLVSCRTCTSWSSSRAAGTEPGAHNTMWASTRTHAHVATAHVA
jgi:hypothetical protein